MHKQFCCWASLTAILAVAVALAVATPGRAASAAGGQLTFVGSTSYTGSETAAGSGALAGAGDQRPESEVDRESTASGADKFWAWWHRHVPSSVPNVFGNPVLASGSEKVASFEGLDHFDQRTANGGNQFSLEPPDQGLCTGGGVIVEAVNDVMSVYQPNGSRTPVVDMNTFFHLPPAINRTTGVRGDFLSDPKCYFDTDTQRFFLTVLQEDPAPSVRAHTLIAVSKTSDPTGDWYLYSLDATDDGLNGTPAHPNCPCFGDQPLIGADTYGFYITTNEFGDVEGFNGAQIYALSKRALEAGRLPAVVQFQNPPLAESVSYSVQPATSPDASQYDRANGGTEYFLSALDFNATTDNRVAAWDVINTRSLDSPHPRLTLQNVVVPSENYGQPVPADQKPGEHPLGDLSAPPNIEPPGQPETTLNTNDDRMNQVVYSNGFLWSGVNTVEVDSTGATKAGIAWFKVYVKSLPISRLMLAWVVNQGYVSVAGSNVLFPSIGVTPAGRAVMTMTLAGPAYYPTAAYSVFDGRQFSSVKIAATGQDPADGFTGYTPVATDGVERWGDYSAAVSTPDGTVWIATEYIAHACSDAQWAADNTCGGTRTTLANWSTRVSAIRP